MDAADITAQPATPPDAGQPGLTREQQAAAAAIEAFIGDPATVHSRFVVQGLAGTGKSTLLTHVTRRHPEALVACPTGKSAAVLRARFGLRAQRIHSIFHRLKSETQHADGRRDLDFTPRRRAGSLAGKVVLIDEGSMVTAQLRDELLATGVRVVAFGDPGQLPPVSGEPAFVTPDVTLTRIHRPAAGSAIIRQAHRVRSGLNYEADGDEFRVERKASPDLVRQADVVLCHRNASRAYLNQYCHRAHGFVRGTIADDGSFDPRTEHPRQWEHVLVLRNAPKHDLWNGDIEWLDENVRIGDREVTLFQVSDSGGSAGGVIQPLASFAGMPGTGGVRDGLELDFGFCLTVHKAQGSEWRNVLIFDEHSKFDRSAWSKWAYSAITRASERVVVIKRNYRP